MSKRFYFLLGMLFIVAIACRQSGVNTAEGNGPIILGEPDILSKGDYENVPKVEQAKTALNKMKAATRADFEIDYYTSTNLGNIFYISKNGLQGLADENFKPILPIEFERIGSFSAFLPNLVEVKRNGMIGFFDITGKEIISVVYKGVFPYKDDPAVLAQVFDGKQFGWLDKKGNAYFKPNSHKDKRLFQSPANTDLLKEWDFEANQLTNALKSNPAHDGFEEHTDIVFLPEYLFLMHKPQNAFLSNYGELKGDQANDFKLKVKMQKEFSENIWYVWATVYEQVIGARIDQYNAEKLLTYNPQFERIAEMNFAAADYNSPCKCENNLKQLSESLWEHRTVVPDLLVDLPENYSCGEVFVYYELQKDGKIIPRNSNRIFDFTKYVKLDESYFNVNMVVYAPEGTFLPGTKEEANMINYSGYSEQDLDIMRNEIYADYGLKFNKPEWKQFFGKQPWYSPQFDNVDDKLTDIDKYNVQFILKMKEKLKAKPRKGTPFMYVAAG